MPAIDLTKGPKTLSRYDVVGERAEGCGKFVKHVALPDKDSQSVEAGGEVGAVHMRPPLRQGETIKVHVAGHVPLTKDEINKVSTWIQKITDEYCEHEVGRGKQYVIHPPWKDVCSNMGVRRYRRYSCAGFVLDAHRQVKIDLLDIEDEKSRPDVNLETIISAYGLRPGLRLHPYGLEGNGPWKVVLAGYILHALDRPTDQIRQKPYQAKSGDEQF